MLPERPGWKMIWLGLASTPAAQGYLYVINEVRNSQTAVFDRRLTIGPADQDSDDFISTLSMGDWSGGGQIDELSGADQSRYWWGIFDNRSPHQAALPPRVYNPDGGKPTGATGSSYPLGVVNNTAYFAFGTDICGFNESGQTWYTKESLGHAPVGKSLSFNGKLFVPCGVNGYKIVEESGTGNPTVTAVAGAADPTTYDPDALIHTSPRPIAFTFFEGDKIFALTTSGGIAWSNTGADGEWEWDYHDALGVYPKLNSSLTPHGLKPYFNRNGIPTLFVHHSGGVYNYDRELRKFNDTTILAPQFPDMARCMEVWRPGEDLWVSMGLDVIHYTAANTTVPLSGVNRDAGLPAAYRGAIVDMQAELSALYALVGGTSELYRSFEYSAKTGISGTGNGEFAAPQAVATDSAENVYVADLQNERIQKFNSSLVYQAKTGGDAGTDDGDFASNDGVYDLAIDGSDNVWAVDTANHRVQKFNSSLVYQSEIDGTATVSQMGTFSAKYGTSGSGTGNYSSPNDVAVDSTGRFIVADRANARVIVRNAAGTYVSATISSGSVPYSVCTDTSDNIYVLWANAVLDIWHVKKYNSALAEQWGLNIESSLESGSGIATNGSSVFVVRSETRKLYKISASAGTLQQTVTFVTGLEPYAIDNAGGYVYVTFYNGTTCSIMKLTTANPNIGEFIINADPHGSSAGELNTPEGIAISPVTGNIFVSDSDTNYISEFSANGTYLQRFGGTGTGDGQLTLPAGIAFTASGDALYVADFQNDRIQKFVASTTTGGGSADDEFTRPTYLAINRGTSDLWVYDAGNAKLKLWNIASTPAYEENVAIDSGSGVGQFASGVAGRIAIAQSDTDDYRLYVVDPGNDRVNIYQRGVGWVGAIGESGTGDGQFSSPVGVAVNEATGHVFVSDSTRDDIQEFTALGVFVRSFGSTGTGDGQMTGPVGMGSGRDGSYVYLVDATQHRITQYQDQEINDSLSSTPHLQAWTGIGWGGVWEGTSGVTPTWMQVFSVVGGYYLAWGGDDGLIYRMKLHRNIHNPRQLLTPFALGDYAQTGYIETASSDMNMLGFKKIASHVKVFMRNATTTERVKVSIEVDDGGWQELGWVTQAGETTFPLNVQTVSETSETASLGLPFNWVRLKLDLERGSTISRTPIIRAVNVHFLKIPQNTTTYAFDVILPKATVLGRDGRAISEYINSLLTANEMVLMKHQGTLYRGRLSNVTGIDNTGEDMAGIRSISFLEISDQGGS